MSSVFGGSKQQATNSSSNQAYPYLQQALSGNVSAGTGATSALSNLLTGGAGADEAFNNYKNSTGYQSTLDAGSKAITGNAAASGLLRSGSTGKALTNYGQQQNQQYYNNYLSQLLGLGNLGNASAGIIAGAGQKSQGQSSGSSKKGIGDMLSLAL